MSKEKAPENNNGADITDKDLFGSIPKPIEIDPFEGLDLEGISLFPEERRVEAKEYDEINPMDGIDMRDIGTLKDRRQRKDATVYDIDGVSPLTGIDIDYIGVEPGVQMEPGETPGERRVPKPSIPSMPEDQKVDAAVLKGTLTLNKAYKYAEINRIRENIGSALLRQNQRTVMITSPHDGTGNTFVVCTLGLNATYFTGMSVLMVDLNMRRPGLHIPFGVSLEKGFSEVAAGFLGWTEAIKDTGFAELKVMTAGRPSDDPSFLFDRALIRDMVHYMKEDFELVIFDTSPVLAYNKNNVDPVYLSAVCDMAIIVVQDKKTTKAMLMDTVDTMIDDGGKVNGIIYNRQFS